MPPRRVRKAYNTWRARPSVSRVPTTCSTLRDSGAEPALPRRLRRCAWLRDRARRRDHGVRRPWAVFTFDFRSLSAAQPPYPDVRVHTGIDLESVDPGIDRCRFTLYRDGGGVSPDSSIVACGIGHSRAARGVGLARRRALHCGHGLVRFHHAGSARHGIYRVRSTRCSLTPRLDPRLRIIDEPAQGSLLLVLAGLAVRTGRVRVRVS